MIEVEKQCQPTEEQFKVLLEDAKFTGKKINHDIYYDYDDYKLFKNDIRLRKRNGSFELKVGKSSGVSEEIEKKENIEKYFNVESLEEFVHDNLTVIIEYSANRKEYKKEGFTITIDEMSFGYKVCEIELMVEKEEYVEDAKNKIVAFASKFNVEIKKLHAKRDEYFRLMKPEVHKELYG